MTLKPNSSPHTPSQAAATSSSTVSTSSSSSSSKKRGRDERNEEQNLPRKRSTREITRFQFQGATFMIELRNGMWVITRPAASMAAAIAAAASASPSAAASSAAGSTPVGDAAVGPQEVETIEASTEWGWTFTREQAISFFKKEDFLIPDGKVALLFSPGFNRRPRREAEPSAQFVPFPSPLEVGEAVLLERCRENAFTAAQLLRLVGAARESGGSLRTRAGELHQRLSDKNVSFRVTAAPHCSRNNPADKSYRITVKLNVGSDYSGAHLTLAFLEGSSSRSGNQGIVIDRWNGNSKKTVNIAITEIKEWSRREAVRNKEQKESCK